MAEEKSEKKKKEESEEEVPKKSVIRREDKQLFWFFLIIGLVFAAVLIPYFHSQSVKSFNYANANWSIEDYKGGLRIYHGRFKAFTDSDIFYNIYLRIDPRENNVNTTGTFNKFQYGSILSLSPQAGNCRGEVARITLDLGMFLKQAIGDDSMEIGTTDKDTSIAQGTRFSTCDTVLDRNLVILEVGNESSVVQDPKNKYCYTIQVKNCEDIAPVEKFIVKSINDMGNKRIAILSSGEK